MLQFEFLVNFWATFQLMSLEAEKKVQFAYRDQHCKQFWDILDIIERNLTKWTKPLAEMLFLRTSFLRLGKEGGLMRLRLVLVLLDYGWIIADMNVQAVGFFRQGHEQRVWQQTQLQETAQTNGYTM